MRTKSAERRAARTEETSPKVAVAAAPFNTFTQIFRVHLLLQIVLQLFVPPPLCLLLAAIPLCGAQQQQQQEHFSQFYQTHQQEAASINPQWNSFSQHEQQQQQQQNQQQQQQQQIYHQGHSQEKQLQQPSSAQSSPSAQQFFSTVSTGKNHLQGIRRLHSPPASPANVPGEGDGQLLGPEHRHLRHIASPARQQRAKMPQFTPVGKAPMSVAPQRAKALLPSNAASTAIDEREILAMNSAEAEELALKLLQEAGIEHSFEKGGGFEQQLETEKKEQTRPQPTTRRRSKKRRRKTKTTTKISTTTTPLPSSPSPQTESQLLAEKSAERSRARWRKIGPLSRGNAPNGATPSSSLLPFRRLKMVQRRRKLNNIPETGQKWYSTTTLSGPSDESSAGRVTTTENIAQPETATTASASSSSLSAAIITTLETTTTTPTTTNTPNTTPIPTTTTTATTTTTIPTSSATAELISKTTSSYSPYTVLRARGRLTKVPRARKLLGGRLSSHESEIHVSAASIDEIEVKKNAEREEENSQFDFASARRALLEAKRAQQKEQEQQKRLEKHQKELQGIASTATEGGEGGAEEEGTVPDQLQKQPKPWQPTLRLLRHRYRQRFEEAERQQQQERQQQNNLLRPLRQRQKSQIFDGPLLAEYNAIDERNRQFGLRNEPRRAGPKPSENNNEQELLRLESGPESAKEQANDRSSSLHLEQRFRLVPNKVVFRPRLKIRRPQNNIEPQQPIVSLSQQSAPLTGQQPIDLHSLSAFDGPSEGPSVPVPPPPSEPAPLQASPPPPSQPETSTEPATTTTPTTPPPPPTTTTTPPTTPAQPAPAMEVGSVGEQPPQNIPQGGPPTTTTPPTSPQQQQQVDFGDSGIILGENGATANNGLVGSQDPVNLHPGFSEQGIGLVGGGNEAAEDNGLNFGVGPELGTFPPGFKESFALNGFVTGLGSNGGGEPTATNTDVSTSESTTPTTTTTSTSQTTTELPTTITSTESKATTTIITTPSTTTSEPPTTTTQPTTTQQPSPPPTQPSPAPPSPPTEEEVFVIPENSGLRPVAPPREFAGGGGFGSSAIRGGGGAFGGGGFGNGGHSRGLDPPPVGAQVEPPQQPLKPEDFFTGDSALTPNKRGPEGDGYGPSVLPGAAIPPAPAGGPAIGVGGAAAGILMPPPLPAPMLPPPFRPIPNAIGGPPVGGGVAAMVAPPQESAPENEATTMKPSALMNILNKADEGFNQVITHFEQGTPLEAAAIDIMEVALGSQKLDSQAKLLSHVDRAFGLDNLQRLQRWANTGGALDLLKEQFAKIAKNYKPPPETANLFTVPPQLEYLFQPGSSG